MQFYELLNALLKLLIPYPEKEAKDKSTITLTSISKNKFEYKEDNYTYLFTYTKDYPLTSFKVEDKFEYQNILEILYKKYSKKYKNIFHINTIEMYITQNILEKKLQGIIFTKKEDNIFFNELNKRPKIDWTFSYPISGLSFEDIDKTIEFGCFSIGYINSHQDNKTFFPKDVEYYIQMTINQTQDNEIAYEQFISSCDDFISILLFIAGDVHRKFRIKIGYPVYLKHPIKPDTLIDMPEYYLITTPLNNKITKIETNSISSNFRNLPLGSKLLSQDAHLFQLWNFYAKQELSDIEGRILRASIAVGKAIRSINFSESILYTCIALETLFIYNKDLQSRSTTSDMLGYIIKDNLNDDKVDYIKELAKNIYDNRSDIMHGRKVKNPQQDYMSVNVVLRNAIVNLLADEKYKNIKSAEELYHLYY